MAGLSSRGISGEQDLIDLVLRKTLPRSKPWPSACRSKRAIRAIAVARGACDIAPIWLASAPRGGEQSQRHATPATVRLPGASTGHASNPSSKDAQRGAQLRGKVLARTVDESRPGLAHKQSRHGAHLVFTRSLSVHFYKS
jgi:hypothetical protein